MSADQKWLDSLKPGDKFVMKTRHLDTFGRRRGPRIYQVVKIPPKRSKFVVRALLQDGNADGQEFEIKGHGTYITGGGFHKDYDDMLPYTPEVDEQIIKDNFFIRSKNRAGELQELCRLYERLEEIPHEEVAAFIAASKDLLVLLRKRFPKTEV